VEEVQSGKSMLMLDATEHKRLVRVVDIVLLRLSYEGLQDVVSEAVFLIERGRDFADGNTRLDFYRLPGTKKEPHESTREVAERILKSRLRMSDCKVVLNFEGTEVYEEEQESTSYPQICTVYRKEIVEGQIQECTDNAVLERIGVQSARDEQHRVQDDLGIVRYFTWLTEAESDDRDVQLTAPTADGEYVSCLVRAPVGLEEEALREYLEANKVDFSRFGESNAKTLEALANELISGECVLAKHSDGLIRRVVDVVLLRLIRADTREVLFLERKVFPDGGIQPQHRAELNQHRLPGGKRRPDENQFLAVRRLIRQHLRLDPNDISFDKHDVMVVEEESDSISFPGLRTLYRKRILSGVIERRSEPANATLDSFSALHSRTSRRFCTT